MLLIHTIPNPQSTVYLGPCVFFSSSPVSDTFPTRLMYFIRRASVFFLFLIRFIVHIIILPSSMLRCCVLIKRTLFTNKKIHQHDNPNGKEQKKKSLAIFLRTKLATFWATTASVNQSLHPCFELHIIHYAELIGKKCEKKKMFRIKNDSTKKMRKK